MNLEEMSNEELLNRLDDGDNLDEIEELLSRLNLGKQAIAIVDELHASFTIETPQHLIDMVIDFSKQREGIK